jgi:hypothetical protein
VTDTLLTELRAHGKLHIGTGSLLYQDWQRFAISCDNFSDRMLKKWLFSPALPRRAETRLFPCIVLALKASSTSPIGTELRTQFWVGR